MEKCMVKVILKPKMALYMKVIFRIIISTEPEKCNFLTEKSIQADGPREFERAKELANGQMEEFIGGNGAIIILTVRVYLKACQDREKLNIKAATKMESVMEKAFSVGMTIPPLWEHGKMI